MKRTVLVLGSPEWRRTIGGLIDGYIPGGTPGFYQHHAETIADAQHALRRESVVALIVEGGNRDRAEFTKQVVPQLSWPGSQLECVIFTEEATPTPVPGADCVEGSAMICKLVYAALGREDDARGAVDTVHKIASR